MPSVLYVKWLLITPHCHYVIRSLVVKYLVFSYQLEPCMSLWWIMSKDSEFVDVAFVICRGLHSPVGDASLNLIFLQIRVEDFTYDRRSLRRSLWEWGGHLELIRYSLTWLQMSVLNDHDNLIHPNSVKFDWQSPKELLSTAPAIKLFWFVTSRSLTSYVSSYLCAYSITYLYLFPEGQCAPKVHHVQSVSNCVHNSQKLSVYKLCVV